MHNVFWKGTPSTKPLREEVIRNLSLSILASDPYENDASIYPDNSFQVVPFRPEIQRYGGPDRFRLSLDFFTLSSVAALEFLFRHVAQVGQSCEAATRPVTSRISWTEEGSI